jgi:hypothetical protein
VDFALSTPDEDFRGEFRGRAQIGRTVTLTPEGAVNVTHLR